MVCSQSSISNKNVQKLRVSERFWICVVKFARQKVHERLQRELDLTRTSLYRGFPRRPTAALMVTACDLFLCVAHCPSSYSFSARSFSRRLSSLSSRRCRRSSSNLHSKRCHLCASHRFRHPFNTLWRASIPSPVCSATLKIKKLQRRHECHACLKHDRTIEQLRKNNFKGN